MTAFDNIVNVSKYKLNKDFYISTTEFNNFLKEYTFEKLRGFSMIEYFCSKYNINEYLLQTMKNSSDDIAKQILNSYYVK